MNAEQGERRAIVREATAFSLASYLFQLISVLRGFVVAWFLGPALYGVWNIFKTFLETGTRYQLGYNYKNWSYYLSCIGSDLFQGGDKSTAHRHFKNTLRQPRARNTDWRCALAKTALELQDSRRV